jgi:hypothetical protein
MPLIRYWFYFDRSQWPTPVNLGCGVTAYDLADARKLILESVFFGKESVQEIGYLEDVDISTLDEKHVRPNMGSPASRGVWFPIQS